MAAVPVWAEAAEAIRLASTRVWRPCGILWWPAWEHDGVRMLGVDVGEARTGLALSDPHGITCRPLGILSVKDRQALAVAVADVAQREDVSAIVVGVPRPLSGGVNQQMRAVVAFIKQLQAATSRPVLTWDERFTSKLAKKNRRPGERLDDVAACHLLQSYLDHVTPLQSGESE